MKLPNGFGSVYKLPGKRRKPWAASKTTGWEINTKTNQSMSTKHGLMYISLPWVVLPVSVLLLLHISTVLHYTISK